MFLSLLLCCCSLCLMLLISSLLTYFFSRKNPKSYPLIGSLIAFYKNRRRLIHWYTQLLSESHSQTIVVRRLGAQRTIVTANPDNVEYILKTKFCNFPKGKAFTEFLGDFLGFGIFNVDGELWNSQRKLASHEFSTKSLREFVVKVLEEEVEDRLLPLLENACRTGGVLDLQQVLKSFAFDSICKVALGVDPSRLDLLGSVNPSTTSRKSRKQEKILLYTSSQYSSEVAPLANAFDTASMISAMRGAALVNAVWKLKRALNIGSERRLKEAVAVVHGAVDEIIQLKRKKMRQNLEKNSENNQNHEENSENNLLWRLLSAGNDDELVRDMVISFLMAGKDTTSSAMTWLFWLVSRNVDVEKELLNEINSSTDELVFEKLKEMKYMKACICESMRLYPPVVWDSKHAANDDVLPDGTVVYKGNRVTYFPYGMGRMEELWGKDRLEFRPDRWFDESGGLKMVSPYKYPVFQAGPRVCLGKEMAFIQMKYVVASVLRRFVIKPVCMDQPVFVPLLTGHMAGGLKVRVFKRV